MPYCDVSHLVGEQALPTLARRYRRLPSQVHLVTEGKGPGVHTGRRASGIGPCLQTDWRQVDPQLPLKLATNPHRQRLPRLLQHPTHRRWRHPLPA